MFALGLHAWDKESYQHLLFPVVSNSISVALPLFLLIAACQTNNNIKDILKTENRAKINMR